MHPVSWRPADQGSGVLRSARREASCSLVGDLKAAVQSQLQNAGKAAALIGASALLAGVRACLSLVQYDTLTSMGQLLMDIEEYAANDSLASTAMTALLPAPASLVQSPRTGKVKVAEAGNSQSVNVQSAEALTFDQIQGLTYKQVKGTGVANTCPVLEEGGDAKSLKAGKYKINKYVPALHWQATPAKGAAFAAGARQQSPDLLAQPAQLGQSMA